MRKSTRESALREPGINRTSTSVSEVREAPSSALTSGQSAMLPSAAIAIIPASVTAIDMTGDAKRCDEARLLRDLWIKHDLRKIVQPPDVACNPQRIIYGHCSIGVAHKDSIRVAVWTLT